MRRPLRHVCCLKVDLMPCSVFLSTALSRALMTSVTGLLVLLLVSGVVMAQGEMSGLVVYEKPQEFGVLPEEWTVPPDPVYQGLYGQLDRQLESEDFARGQKTFRQLLIYPNSFLLDAVTGVTTRQDLVHRLLKQHPQLIDSTAAQPEVPASSNRHFQGLVAQYQQDRISASGLQALYQLACQRLDRGEYTGAQILVNSLLQMPVTQAQRHKCEDLELLCRVHLSLQRSDSGAERKPLIRLLDDHKASSLAMQQLFESLKTELGNTENRPSAPQYAAAMKLTESVVHRLAQSPDWSRQIPESEFHSIGPSLKLHRNAFLQTVAEEFRNDGLPHDAVLSPVQTSDALLLRTAEALICVEKQTGKIRWQLEQPDQTSPLLNHPELTGQYEIYQNVPLMSYYMHQNYRDTLQATLSVDEECCYQVLADGIRSLNQYGQFDALGISKLLPQATNRLRAVNLQTGKLLWEIGGELVAPQNEHVDTYFLGAPVSHRGKLYGVVEQEGELQLITLDARDGQVQHRQSLMISPLSIDEDRMRSLTCLQPVFHEGLIIVSTEQGAVFAYDPLLQDLVWSKCYLNFNANENPKNYQTDRSGAVRQASHQIRSDITWMHTGIHVAQGLLILSAHDAEWLFAIELATGKLRWKQPRKRGLCVAGVNKQAVIVQTNQGLIAYSLQDGDLLWSQSLPALQMTEKAVVQGEWIYCLSENLFQVYHTHDGHLCASIPLSVEQVESLSITKQGVLCASNSQLQYWSLIEGMPEEKQDTLYTRWQQEMLNATPEKVLASLENYEELTANLDQQTKWKVLSLSLPVLRPDDQLPLPVLQQVEQISEQSIANQTHQEWVRIVETLIRHQHYSQALTVLQNYAIHCPDANQSLTRNGSLMERVGYWWARTMVAVLKEAGLKSSDQTAFEASFELLNEKGGQQTELLVNELIRRMMEQKLITPTDEHLARLSAPVLEVFGPSARLETLTQQLNAEFLLRLKRSTNQQQDTENEKRETGRLLSEANHSQGWTVRAQKLERRGRFFPRDEIPQLLQSQSSPVLRRFEHDRNSGVIHAIDETGKPRWVLNDEQFPSIHQMQVLTYGHQHLFLVDHTISLISEWTDSPQQESLWSTSLAQLSQPAPFGGIESWEVTFKQPQLSQSVATFSGRANSRIPITASNLLLTPRGEMVIYTGDILIVRDMATGHLKWQQTGVPENCLLSEADGIIYLTQPDGHFTFQMELAQPDQQIKSRKVTQAILRNPVPANQKSQSPFLGTYGEVEIFVERDFNQLNFTGVSLKNGKVVWSRDVESQGRMLDFEQSYGLVSNDEQRLELFDLRTGKLLWSTQVELSELESIELLRWGSDYVVLANEPVHRTARPGAIGNKHQPVNGMIFLLDGQTKQTKWSHRMYRQYLIQLASKAYPLMMFSRIDEGTGISYEFVDRETGEYVLMTQSAEFGPIMSVSSTPIKHRYEVHCLQSNLIFEQTSVEP